MTIMNTKVIPTSTIRTTTTTTMMTTGMIAQTIKKMKSPTTTTSMMIVMDMNTLIIMANMEMNMHLMKKNK